MDAYGDDLAYIHEAGFSDLARSAARRLLEELRRGGVEQGLVVDLGCGSGGAAGPITQAGYDLLGVDRSAAMIDLASRVAPRASLEVGSFLDLSLPRCEAVIAVGEVFNYLFDERNTEPALTRCFRQVHAALRPGGLFMFDLAGPGRAPAPDTSRTFHTGEDWATLVELTEEPEQRLLTRRITSFRRMGVRYRRSEEVHRLRLHRPAGVLASLREVGFRARALRGYRDEPIGRGLRVFLARKP